MPVKSRTVEASLGLPSDEFTQKCGALDVPYLSLSWKELKEVKTLAILADDDFMALMYRMLTRRLPALTEEQFEDNCGPANFVPWVNLVQAGPDSGNA